MRLDAVQIFGRASTTGPGNRKGVQQPRRYRSQAERSRLDSVYTDSRPGRKHPDLNESASVRFPATLL